MKTPMLAQLKDGSRWWLSQGLVDDDAKCTFCRARFQPQQPVIVMDQIRRAFQNPVWLGTVVAHSRCADGNRVVIVDVDAA